jgi:cytosine/adenosine deaminase-related metal-dependent hydrolase
LVNLLDSYGILGPDLLIAHATQASHDDAVKLVEANAHISSTPDTELQMALGEPVCFRADLESISSLGVDCHTASSTGIFGQMHLALQNARGTRNQRLIEDGKFPDSIFPTVEEAYNLGTIKGARAIRQEADIGSLAVGKKADIVIFDATSPALICASQHDPVSAIVLHASSRDIDYVMIDGHVRKENGAILPVVIEREISPDEGGTVSWKDIAEELLRSRKEIQERIDQIDLSNTRSEVITAFQIDRTSLSG